MATFEQNKNDNKEFMYAFLVLLIYIDLYYLYYV